MVLVSKEDLVKLAVAFGIADFFSGGRLQAPAGNAARKALVKAGPAIARGIVRYGPTAALTAARVTPTPLAAAVTGAALVQNREVIRDVAGNVYERVAPAAAQFGQEVLDRARDPQTFQRPEETDLFPISVVPRFSTKKVKKKLSKFNKAVKAGMAAVKKSTSFGKRGKINNARKAFSAVTKVTSKVNRGAKVSAKGVTGTIARAVRKIL